MSKRYYWLKLKHDFFKRHDIQIVESMTNGKDYVLFYLKLLAESVDHEGRLRFNDTIPYNETMLATITNTNVDIVRAAMRLFEELKLVEVLSDETIYLSEVEKMLGTETYWAEQKRKQRESVKELPDVGHCPQLVQCVQPMSNQEKEKEKDIPPLPPKGGTLDNDEHFTLFWEKYPRKTAKTAAMKAWKKLHPDETLFDEIMSGLQKAVTSTGWTKDNGQFIPYPATWLNGRRWEDELQPSPSKLTRESDRLEVYRG